MWRAHNLHESGCGASACDRAAKGVVLAIGMVSVETLAPISSSERVGAVYFGIEAPIGAIRV